MASPMNIGEALGPEVVAVVLRATGAGAVDGFEPVQQLWSGYGHIVRCVLREASVPSVIVKHVRWPSERDHPYGWTSDRSHQRKARSYRVEATWYERYASSCQDACRVPEGLVQLNRPDGIILVMEDLGGPRFSGSGWPGDRPLGEAQLDACLGWLAAFHAQFLGQQPDGLWPIGTYWHLDTRPDEFDALDDGPLKAAAVALDRRLAESPFQTVVHGDAKLANFCFAADAGAVAAVDFQYVGGGCGIKDVAYFISSCFHEADCERFAPELLDRYFGHLRRALHRCASTVDLDALEADWRTLYPVAWADFNRFLQGWQPGHWKLHGYSERLTAEALGTL